VYVYYSKKPCSKEVLAECWDTAGQHTELRQQRVRICSTQIACLPQENKKKKIKITIKAIRKTPRFYAFKKPAFFF